MRGRNVIHQILRLLAMKHAFVTRDSRAMYSITHAQVSFSGKFLTPQKYVAIT
jgi:hypothetical protein